MKERKKEMSKTKKTRQIVAVLCISFCPDPCEDGRPLCAESDHFSACFVFGEAKSKILFLKKEKKRKKATQEPDRIVLVPQTNYIVYLESTDRSVTMLFA